MKRNARHDEALSRRALLRSGLFGGLAAGLAGCGSPGPGNERDQAVKAIEAAPVYDLSAFTDVPAELLSHVEERSLPSPLADARALARLPDASLLLVGSRLLHLQTDGRVIASIDLPNQATAVCCDERHVLVALSDRIQVFDHALSLQAEGHSLGDNARLCSIAVQGERVAATDFGQRLVWMLDLEGRPQAQIDGKTAEEPHGFHLPSPWFACAFLPDGALLVVDPGRHQVETWRDGRQVAGWGTAGMAIERFSGCCNPTHIALLANGDIVTSEKGLPRIKRYSPSGELRAVIAAPSSFKPATQGLALAVDGEALWVLDPKRQQLIHFVPKAKSS